MPAIAVGATGYLGWKVLQRTSDRQIELVKADPTVSRNLKYFNENISKVKTADDLVSDYRLLSVTLEAFGLGKDVNSKYLIRKVLEADPGDEKSLVNKLSDKRYKALSEVLGLHAGKGVTMLPTELSQKYIQQAFESSVGETDENLKLAMYAKRALNTLASQTSSDATKWYSVIGDTSLRKVFEGAFGLSKHFAALPVDRQLTDFSKKAEQMFGGSSLSAFTEPENVEKLIKIFLIKAQTSSASSFSPFSAALTILQS